MLLQFIEGNASLLTHQNCSCTWLCISRQNQITTYKGGKRGAVTYNHTREKFMAAFPTWCLQPEYLLEFTWSFMCLTWQVHVLSAQYTTYMQLFWQVHHSRSLQDFTSSPAWSWKPCCKWNLSKSYMYVAELKTFQNNKGLKQQ